MKTLAIYLLTTNNLDLTDDQKHLLEGLTIDRRLKKAESIKAHLESDEYMLKKVSFQMKHAEFGKIKQLITFDGRDTDMATGEEAALHLIDKAIAGVEKLVVFDADFTIPFILKRAMLIGHEESPGLSSIRMVSRESVYSLEVIDVKRLWAGQNKEYSGMTLNQLNKYFNIDPLAAYEAERVYEIYEKMKGFLCS